MTRLPTFTTQHDGNGVTPARVKSVVDYWRESYDWRAEETRINAVFPQYLTTVEVEGYGEFTMHFVHSKAKSGSIPLLFIHGWPGSFLEVEKGMRLLNDAGYDVVAPSLPGFGFSSFTEKPGFDIQKAAEALHNLMKKIGYDKFVVQGGDWGAHITRTIDLLYPDSIIASHQNMV